MLRLEPGLALGDAALAQDHDLPAMTERLDNGLPFLERRAR